MAKLTLGLDVGVNSIGWALVDVDGCQTLAAGVRVFPEGVDRDQKGGEKSKTQDRRTARGVRRQIHRLAKKRNNLRRALLSLGMIPFDPTEFQRLLGLNPYELRARALREKLSPHELGRVFLHLGQRRGYLSNRKTDRAADKETNGILAEMGELAAAMQQADCPTLGVYLAQLDAAFDRCAQAAGPHLLRRHTKREMYEEEFERIWAAQRQYHPDLLTEELKYGRRGRRRFVAECDRKQLGKRSNLLAEGGIFGLLFFQRKMYWPKSVVGRCELEPREKRCPRAARVAQRFRIVQEVNNIQIWDGDARISRRLDSEEREKVVGRLMESEDLKFDQIRKLMKFSKAVRFNFEATRKKLNGHLPDNALGGKKYLGKRWRELSEETKDRVVDILIEEDQEEDAIRRLVGECHLTEEESRRIANVNFPEGYMSFSRRAIEKLLPHMERGLMLMGNDASNSALHAAGYLRPDERTVHRRQFLPPSPRVTNPIVRQALVEVRKTVNAVLRELVHRQGHTLDAIHVELAREAKKSFEDRKQMRTENAGREKIREEAAKAIEAMCGGKVKPTRAAVNRYLLWQIQEEHCPYCGQKITPEQLFDGEADIDHILPRWRSLGDSMGNKVVAHRRCNNEKGDRTPREWLEHNDPSRYEQAMQFAKRYLSNGKQLKFSQKGIDPDSGQKLPKGIFSGANAPRMKSGVPIRRVRMVERSKTFRKVSERRAYQYVKPGNNHHIVYRVVEKKNGQKRWTAEVVTMWEAARRAKAGLPLVDRADRGDGKFLMSLSIGEMFEIDAADSSGRLLCVVRKLNQRGRTVFYKPHTDARKAGDVDKDNLCLSASQMQARNAKKVTVNPIGRLRRADAKSTDFPP